MMTIEDWLGLVTTFQVEVNGIFINVIIKVRAQVIFIGKLVCFKARVGQGLLLCGFVRLSITFLIREIDGGILVDAHNNLIIEALINFELAELADLISVLIDFVAILAEAQIT